MAQTIPIYLQLPPQMGGTRFGPFTNRIDVGSDAKRNSLALDARHGIFPHHAVAVQTDKGLLTVQPATPQAQVFVIPAGQAQTWPVRAPVQVKPGDTLIFGTPAGPRFLVWVDPQHLKTREQIMAEAKGRGGEAGAIQAIGAALDGVLGAPKQGGLTGEVARRGRAEMLRSGPTAELYKFWSRARSGALTQPRVIVGALVALFGVLTTGGVTCSGMVYALYRAMMQ